MLSVSNTNSSGNSITPAVGPAFVNGSNYGMFLWCATGRDLTPGDSGGLAVVGNESSRTATTTYMRGLSEHLRIQTSSGMPWFHRRICFTYKGVVPFRQTYTGDTGANQVISETSRGMGRLWFNNRVNNTPNFINEIQAVLFKGEQGVDWADLVTAPVDNRRVTLRYDKTFTYHSGNTAGTVREKKLWHPMNKNLVYDDDESALTEVSSFYSVDSKAGMGDYYVLDIVVPGTGASSTDVIQLNATSTLYWHER